MIKRILLTVAVLVVVGGALMIYGTYKAANTFITENEPQMRAYLQMTQEEQDNYVSTHVGELLASMQKHADSDEKAEVEKFVNANKDNPELQKAMISVGRSVMASIILLSEPVVKEMSAEVKSVYQKESDEFEARLDKYEKILESLGFSKEPKDA